jgi:vacuolar-type H+-ATPase catalytic subunit A/Vma1
MRELAAVMPRLRAAISSCRTRVVRGRVERISGTVIEARIGGVRVGEVCRLRDPAGATAEAEVVGVAGDRAMLVPIGAVDGLSTRAELEPTGRQLVVPVGEALLGRMLDGLGRVLDQPDAPLTGCELISIDASPPPALGRRPVERVLPLGTRAVDALLTCAEGQRIGIFGPAGTGNFRSSVVHGAENLVTHVAQDPIGSAKALGSGVLHAGEDRLHGASQAAASGDLGEYVGKGVGNLAVNVGGFFIPGADAADAANLAGKAGEAAEGLNLASKAGDAANALNDAEKAGELGSAARAGETAEASGTIDLGQTANADPLKPGTDPLAEPVRSVKTFSSFEEFEAASKDPAPNTTYRFGDYEWSTDAQGRTIEAGGTVKVQEFGRNNPSLQQEIGHEGRSTDVGFHLIADSLDGPTVRLNVVPGNGKPIGDGLPNLNQGAYKRFENTIRDLASDPANKVEVRIEPRYSAGNATNRPDEFIASYRVNGGKWNTRKLVNK